MVLIRSSSGRDCATAFYNCAFGNHVHLARVPLPVPLTLRRRTLTVHLAAWPLRQPSRAAAVDKVAGLLRFLLGAQPGQRNSALHWTACRFAELVAEGRVAEADATELLLTGAQTLGLPDREARATVTSALRAPVGGAA